jgi:hypothetical protein
MIGIMGTFGWEKVLADADSRAKVLVTLTQTIYVSPTPRCPQGVEPPCVRGRSATYVHACHYG